MGQEPNSRQGRKLKVERLLEEYDYPVTGEELEQRWTSERERYSLRDLAAYFNKSLLETELERGGLQTLHGEVDNIYRLLTDDEITDAEKNRARRRLEWEEVDVEKVENDFVTYQAMRSYLQSRGAEYSQETKDPIDRERTNFEQIIGRTRSVTIGKIEQLQNTGDLDIGEFRTIVDIKVVCEECNSQYTIQELLNRGECQCGSPKS